MLLRPGNSCSCLTFAVSVSTDHRTLPRSTAESARRESSNIALIQATTLFRRKWPVHSKEKKEEGSDKRLSSETETVEHNLVAVQKEQTRFGLGMVSSYDRQALAFGSFLLWTQPKL